MSFGGNDGRDIEQDMIVIEKIMRARYCEKGTSGIVMLNDGKGTAKMFTGTAINLFATASMGLGDLIWRIGKRDKKIAEEIADALASAIRLRFRQLSEEEGVKEEIADALKAEGITEEGLRKMILDAMAKGGPNGD